MEVAMSEHFDSPDDDSLRDALRTAFSSTPDDGAKAGQWLNIVRRIRHRRIRRLTVQFALPALCILLVGAGAFALSLRDGRDPPTRSPGSSQSTAPNESAQRQPALVSTTSDVPAVLTTAAPTTAGPPTTTTIEPTTSTSTSTSAPTPPSAPVTLDIGRTLPLDLNVAGSQLIASSDGAEAFVWSLADGQGLAIEPSGLTTRKIAPLPAEIVSSLCNSDEMAWTGTDVFVASTTNFGLYDPSIDSWATGPLPSPRYCSVKRLTVRTGSRIALLGGSTAPFGDAGYAPITQAWLFDPAASQWSTSSPAPSIRSGELSAAYVKGVIVLAGDGERLDQTPPFLVYHPNTDAWTELDPPGPLTYTPYGAAYGDQLMAIGLDNRASALTDPLNPNWQSFTPSSPPDGGRHSTALVTDGTRLVYLYGSSTSQLSVFDGAGWFESATLDLPTSWSGPSVTKAGHFLVVTGASTASAATQHAVALIIRIDGIGDSLAFGD